MSQPLIGEIRMFAGNFAPAGWLFCNGQTLPISENDALFTLIGTTYGGDGQTTFALPNLQSRVPIHQGNGFLLSETGGAESVTLTVQQMPSHTHVPLCNSGNGSSSDPDNNFWAAQPALLQYAAPGVSNANINTNMRSNAFSPVGGSQPHENMIPYLAVHFIISLFGIYPQQN